MSEREIKQAIEMIAEADGFYLGNGVMEKDVVESLRSITLETLRAELSRRENKPMTLGEIENLNGKPIFIVYINHHGNACSGWFIVDCDEKNTTLCGTDGCLYVKEKGIIDMNNMTAYRYEPKGVFDK